ncbi:MAG: FHIPEP family type III secretion protein [Myxococcales bacterium FL481]|nr:MAG: FHIPEP family type III secretion protein [Myxococcales bacterium FL481]
MWNGFRPASRLRWWSRSKPARELGRMGPAAIVVALVGCVLVPLPTPIVDALLALSLAGGVFLLVAAMRVERIDQLTVFPRLIVLATLYRLALNVSTTRLILSQADAGRVVDAFADVTVRRDLVVGAVIFSVVTLVQYLVVARGAERVAEVTARFALDALPGRQAAIDADLRLNAITASRAQELRHSLRTQSMFHGAMDGAIRFVRHDAVAGVCITAINLIGGLAVGVGRFDLTVADSLDRFGRLTIGDGLVTQVPALLVSLAASLLVARVERESPSDRWVEPSMFVIPGALLLTLAVVPQMPTTVFVVTGLGLFAAAAGAGSRRRESPVSPEVAPVVFTVAKENFSDVARLNRGLAEVRARCQDTLSLDLPALVARWGGPANTAIIHHDMTRIARVPLASSRAEPELIQGGYRALLDYAPALCDLQLIERLIERVSRTKPAVVAEATRFIDRPLLCRLCQALLRGRSGLPPMDWLLQLAATDPAFREGHCLPEELVELVRTRDAPRWLPAQLGALETHGLWRRPTPAFEQIVLECSPPVSASYRARLAAPSHRHDEWRRWMLAGGSNDGRPVAIASSAKARPTFAELFLNASPYVPVVSEDELQSASYRPRHIQWVDPSPVEQAPDRTASTDG